jgi:hypothetical protein
VVIRVTALAGLNRSTLDRRRTVAPPVAYELMPP